MAECPYLEDHGMNCGYCEGDVLPDDVEPCPECPAPGVLPAEVEVSPDQMDLTAMDADRRNKLEKEG